MFNLSAKKHYLTNSFTGFENFFRTRITSVEYYEYQQPEILHIYMVVNPTNEQYTDVQRVDTVVIYNLIKDTYTIKCEGKGSRKYSKKIKYDVAGIIDNLIKDANDCYKGDCSEALSLSVDYYCNQLKEAGCTVAQSNQMYYDINHTYNTIQEIQAAVNTILNELQSNQTEQKGEENMLTINEKESISLRLNIDLYLLENTVFSADELKKEKIISLINEKAEEMVNAILLKNDNIDLSNKSVFEWTQKEKELYRFYINNIKMNILDGTFYGSVHAIRKDYEKYKEKLDHVTKVEKSFSLPDHEVTLLIMIERSNQYIDTIKKDHEKTVKNAIQEGLYIPSEVMEDYKYLLQSNQTESTDNDTQTEETTYTVGNRSFKTYAEAEEYCNACDFLIDMIEDVSTSSIPSNNQMEPEQVKEDTKPLKKDRKPVKTKYRINKYNKEQYENVLNESLNRFINFCNSYPDEREYNNYKEIAEHLKNNLNNICLHVHEYCFDPAYINDKIYPREMLQSLYNYRYMCYSNKTRGNVNDNFQALEQQNENTANYVHYNFSVKHIKTLDSIISGRKIKAS